MLELPNGEVMSIGDLDGSTQENAKLSLHLVVEESGAAGLALAARILSTRTDDLMLKGLQALPSLTFETKFNLPGQLKTDKMTLNSLATESRYFPRLSPEIETLRKSSTNELERDVHSISFVYSGKDFEVSKPNPLSCEEYSNHSLWDAEAVRYFKFLLVLQDPSPKTVTFNFLYHEQERSNAAVSEFFRAIDRNIGLARRSSWEDGCGIT